MSLDLGIILSLNTTYFFLNYIWNTRKWWVLSIEVPNQTYTNWKNGKIKAHSRKTTGFICSRKWQQLLTLIKQIRFNHRTDENGQTLIEPNYSIPKTLSIHLFYANFRHFHNIFSEKNLCCNTLFLLNTFFNFEIFRKFKTKNSFNNCF